MAGASLARGPEYALALSIGREGGSVASKEQFGSLNPEAFEVCTTFTPAAPTCKNTARWFSKKISLQRNMLHKIMES